MKSLVKLACATLSIAAADLSAWKYILLERPGPDGVPGVRMRAKAKDFQDTRFEYRWKSERALDGYVCIVEIRPTDDADRTETLAQINIAYYDPATLTRNHSRIFTAHDVAVGKTAHAYLKPTDCGRVDLVSWLK